MSKMSVSPCSIRVDAHFIVQTWVIANGGAGSNGNLNELSTEMRCKNHMQPPMKEETTRCNATAAEERATHSPNPRESPPFPVFEPRRRNRYKRPLSAEASVGQSGFIRDSDDLINRCVCYLRNLFIRHIFPNKKIAYEFHCRFGNSFCTTLVQPFIHDIV